MIVVFYIYLHESTCAYWMINKEVDIEGAKVDIENKKVDIGGSKVDIRKK